jgi:hypothetical protein
MMTEDKNATCDTYKHLFGEQNKTVFLLTFRSLAIARIVIPSPRCLIRCFWNSVRFDITADKITVNSDCKSQFYFDFILTIQSLIEM